MTQTRYYPSPRWTAEIADCSMPMTFDQYSNCKFNCLYCFATYQRAVGGKNANSKYGRIAERRKQEYMSGVVRSVNIDRVKRIFTEPGYSQFWPWVKDKRVIQWGGMSDPFCLFEKKLGVGLELLKFFKELNYPICFSTKGTWWLNDKRYTDLFRGQKNWNVKVSIITMDRRKARIIEQYVPSPNRRLEAIEKIVNLDCGGATLRFRPFMLGISEPLHTQLITEAGKRGASAVSTEFFCLERRSNVLKQYLKTISDLVGYDYLKMYAKYSSGSGYLRLNRNIKRQFIDEMEEAARAAGMRFYVSDAHFKERCDNGSCCGLDDSWNYSRGQFCQALLLCKRNGKVTWPEVAKDMEAFDTFMWRQAENFNTGSAENRAKWRFHTMKNYLRWLWNNPKAGQSPYTMFEGIMRPESLDDEGNVIYVYDKTRE